MVNKLAGKHTILNLTMAVFRHVTPNSFVDTYHFDMITTVVLLSETVEFIYETTRRHITEGPCVEDYRHENFKKKI